LIKADIHLFEVPLKAVCNVQFLSICEVWYMIQCILSNFA
jgi:hypothetical protein